MRVWKWDSLSTKKCDNVVLLSLKKIPQYQTCHTSLDTLWQEECNGGSEKARFRDSEIVRTR